MKPPAPCCVFLALLVALWLPAPAVAADLQFSAIEAPLKTGYVMNSSVSYTFSLNPRLNFIIFSINSTTVTSKVTFNGVLVQSSKSNGLYSFIVCKPSVFVRFCPLSSCQFTITISQPQPVSTLFALSAAIGTVIPFDTAFRANVTRSSSSVIYRAYLGVELFANNLDALITFTPSSGDARYQVQIAAEQYLATFDPNLEYSTTTSNAIRAAVQGGSGWQDGLYYVRVTSTSASQAANSYFYVEVDEQYDSSPLLSLSAVKIFASLSAVLLCLFAAAAIIARRRQQRRAALFALAQAQAEGPKGATPEQLAAMKQLTFQANLYEPDDAKCAVCLGEYAVGDQLRVLPCQHHFHTPCVDRWLSTHTTCPLCNQDINAPPSLSPRQYKPPSVHPAADSPAPAADANGADHYPLDQFPSSDQQSSSRSGSGEHILQVNR